METAILLRFAERIIGVLIGGMAIYLGYRLFLKIPDRQDGEGRFSLRDVSIVISRVGPGVFFALFGASVVGVSFFQGTEAEWRPDSQRFSGMGAEAPLTTDRRALLRRDIAILNNIVPKLSAGLPEQDRAEVELALPRIKFALMKPAWAEGEDGWSDPRRFEIWLNDGQQSPPPIELEAAVRFFHYGDPAHLP
ncbi:hypothetical protein [Sedimenticola selenatireducens]|uniref:hypothetical protein n=1 Tax=Sedimenticola selenatireducens TaxID=191960 RepID=UPI002AABC211|nr:hypothetical protein [Sedimenticola selenatireducens]